MGDFSHRTFWGVGKGEIPRIVWVIYCTAHFVCYHKKHKTKKQLNKILKQIKKKNYKYTTTTNTITKEGTKRTNNVKSHNIKKQTNTKTTKNKNEKLNQTPNTNK